MARLGNKDDLTLEEKQALIKTQALIHAESFYHYKLIARAAGITDDTLKKYRDEDQSFSEQLEQARTRFIDKKMKVAKPEFLLERLEPELFKLRTEKELRVSDLPKPLLGGNSVSTDHGNEEAPSAQ